MFQLRRRDWLAVVLGTAAGLANARPQPRPVAIEVFRSPTCGCCGGWVDHLKANGFTVKVTEVDDTSTVRRRHGLPDRYASCHTGLVAGYVVEGHVPAAEVHRLLALKPAAVGIAVPAMPVGSPGMEMGNRQDPYDVFLVDKSGRATVFASYPKGGAAQADHAEHADHAAHATAGVDAEVRKVDKAQGRLTLRHGPIPNLDMPGMTMVFRVAKPELLDGVKQGDKVTFTAERVDGVITVTLLSPAG